MSNEIDAIVAGVFGLLGPYMAKGAEEFAKTAGKEAFEQAKKLTGVLKRRLGGTRKPRPL
jgi:hypothetical protein